VRLRILSILFLLAGLGACSLPRPWLGPANTHVCPEQSIDGERLLIVSFRLPDCRKGPLEWSDYRSEQPHFGVADAVGATHRVGEKLWWDELRARVTRSSNDPVVYIHGFYNSEDDAVTRSLAIRALLCPRHTPLAEIEACKAERPVVALTWPSLDRFAKYTWDETNSDWATEPAVAVILRIAREYPRSILIAHSMGNRLLIPAALAARSEGLKLEQLILASADVDREVVARLLRQPAGIGFPATFYASRADQALSASWRVHGYPRAGDLTTWVSGDKPAFPYDVVKNAEIVDTTAVTADLAEHAAFIESYEGATDLCHQLALDDHKPGRAEDVGHPHYWTLKEGVPPDDECALLAWAAVRIASGQPLTRR
jgi:hypothetical protein